MSKPEVLGAGVGRRLFLGGAVELGLFGFVFSSGVGAVSFCKPLWERGLRWFWG